MEEIANGATLSNGVSSSAKASVSPAAALLQKHHAEESHRPTVEETVDEEDVIHPPLSSKHPHTSAGALGSVLEDAAALKAPSVGGETEKQNTTTASRPEKPVFDTRSTDMFPELAKGPKPRASASVPLAWSTKKAAPIRNAGTNGLSSVTNGGTPVLSSSNVSSGASTPISGLAISPSGLDSPMRAAPTGNKPSEWSFANCISPEGLRLKTSHLKPKNQLRKPVQEIVRDINRSSRVKVEIRPTLDGLLFEAKGPRHETRNSLKAVSKEIAIKSTIKYPIPISVRPHIIGRQGAVIKKLSLDSGCRIQVPRAEENSQAHLGDDDTVQLALEGDPCSIGLAIQDIEAIVKQQNANITHRLKDIPAEFFPFIAGAHNSGISALEDGRDVRIHVPQYHTWVHQPPPEIPSADEVPTFIPSQGPLIELSGDRMAIQEARAEIASKVAELRQQLTLSQLHINRGQHQFIIGERGLSMNDFLVETGCTVILPPSNEDTDILTIVGPTEAIDVGIDKIWDLAKDMQGTTIDISRQHPKAPHGAHTHARNVTRYLKQRREIERLEKMYDAHIALPSFQDGAASWEIYSRDLKKSMRAKQEVMNLINGHPPSRLAHVDLDPLYYERLRGSMARQAKDDHGVHVLVPDDEDDDGQILLVYEGIPTPGQDYVAPKKQPSPAEIVEFERALLAVQSLISEMTEGQQEIVDKVIFVPQKFHEKTQRFIDRKLHGLEEGILPVRVHFGDRTPRKGSIPTDQTSNEKPASPDTVFLRGPVDRVEALAQSIHEFVEQEKIDETERGHVITFDYPQKYANILIGKRGENIRKLRDEFDVDIQVQDGKVDIKGPKAKGEACKARITALRKKLEDEASYVLKIDPKYHKDLIGSKGSTVNRLQERYGVRINFPRTTQSFGDDSQSNADTASEVGGRSGRPSQGHDEVFVRGPKKGADQAREELLNLLQYTKDTSHTASVSIARKQVPSLIGQGGREMQNIRIMTGAQIEVPRDVPDSAPRTEIQIRGTKKQVEDAKKLIEERSRAFDATVVRTVEIDKKHHKALIGGGGAHIRDVIVKAGGPDNSRELARMVRFPNHDVDENLIRVEGNQVVVDKIIASLEEIIKRKESETIDTIDVPQEKHRMIIGRGGDVRRNLESQFGVSIDVPKQGQGRTAVKITGEAENVAKCKSHIGNMIKEKEGHTVQVPRRVHHTIADDGQFARHLRYDFKVNVDHEGHQPPPKPTGEVLQSRGATANLPLITDDQDSEAYFWTVRDTVGKSAEEGDIPWVLRGNAAEVTKARARLENAIKQAMEQSSMGYLILPDPKTYRFVIGPGGAEVKNIKSQTGCKITVPHDQAKGEAIEIIGSKEGVEQAKDIILQLVKDGGSAGNGRGRGQRREY